MNLTTTWYLTSLHVLTATWSLTVASLLFCHDILLFKTTFLTSTSVTELDHEDPAVSYSTESDTDYWSGF